jgi:hypothetical protein
MRKCLRVLEHFVTLLFSNAGITLQALRAVNGCADVVAVFLRVFAGSTS